jgi:hypothetical protein
VIRSLLLTLCVKNVMMMSKSFYSSASGVRPAANPWFWLLGLVLGGLVGYVTGLLLAPRSGQATLGMAQQLPQQWHDPYSPTRQLVSKRQAQFDIALDTLAQRRRARRLARAKRREEAAGDA